MINFIPVLLGNMFSQMELWAVDTWLVSSTSAKGGSSMCRFALIDSLLNESCKDDCLTFTEIEGRLILTFIRIITTFMVDDTDNGMEYIDTNHHKIEQMSTSGANQEDNNIKPLVIDLLDSSGDGISATESDNIKEQEEGEGKKEIPQIVEDQDNSELGIIPITDNAPLSHSADWTVEQVELRCQHSRWGGIGSGT